MLPEPEELREFREVQQMIMHFVNQRLRILSARFDDPAGFFDFPIEQQALVRNALMKNLDLIDAFTSEERSELTDKQISIVSDWKYGIRGRFVVYRRLTNDTVFLSRRKPTTAYGVRELCRPIESVIGQPLPSLVDTVLLPYKNSIVTDGIILSYPMKYGPEGRGGLNEEYRRAKERHGIVRSIPKTHDPLEAKLMMMFGQALAHIKPRPEPEEVLPVIINLTTRFCEEHLDEEYSALCEKMARAIASSQPMELTKSQPKDWASGIVQAIGMVNFESDVALKTIITTAKIERYFGSSTRANVKKTNSIKAMFGLYPLNPNWMIPRVLASNSLF